MRVNPEIMSTVRFYDENVMFTSRGITNCRMLSCKYWAICIIILICILIRSI